MEFALELLEPAARLALTPCVKPVCKPSRKFWRNSIPLTDYMITDIKNMDTEVHKKWSGVGNEQIRPTSSKTVKAGVNLTIRIPIIPASTTAKRISTPPASLSATG